MLVIKSWDAMTDEEMLIEMDDFGDAHTTIHEAAKRIRAKSDRIAILEAEAEAVRDTLHGVILGTITEFHSGRDKPISYNLTVNFVDKPTGFPHNTPVMIIIAENDDTA